MFEEAAKNYYGWYCSVGGGNHTVKGRLHGQGCVLDDHHVLTAYHCWSSVSSQYKWPVVFRVQMRFMIMQISLRMKINNKGGYYV